MRWSLLLLTHRLNLPSNVFRRLGISFSNAEDPKNSRAMSTMTAAGADESSKSWRKFGSAGRHCGSISATTIINKMMEVDESRRLLGFKANGDEEEEETTDEQEESYAEFTRLVYRTLLEDIDRRDHEHTTTSIAQDDAWSMCWTECIGTPLTDLGKREQIQRLGNGANATPWRH